MSRKTWLVDGARRGAACAALSDTPHSRLRKATYATSSSRLLVVRTVIERLGARPLQRYSTGLSGCLACKAQQETSPLDITNMPKLRSSSCVCAATLLLARAAVASSIQDTVQPAYNLVPGSSDDPHNRIVHPFSEQALLHTRSKVVKGGSNTTDSLGRYGHAAAYIPSQNQILFIGGQVGVAGTYITNDVVVLDLSLPLANATQSSSANPARHPDFSVDLPPSAWGAATVDSYEQIWLVGGVTQNCEIDAPGYVFNSTNGIWRPVAVGNKRPPRRRQAHAVLLPGRGQQSVQDEIYIFGGIAEQYTCSLDTVAYLAIDDWQPQQANPALVNTTLWHAPTYGRSIPPAVSDYAVFKLPQCHDGVVYIGGQDASGKLLGMDTALLYNTTTKLWAQVVSAR